MTRRKQELLFPFTKLLVMSNKYVMASRGYIMIYQVAAAAAAAGIVFYVCMCLFLLFLLLRSRRGSTESIMQLRLVSIR